MQDGTSARPAPPLHVVGDAAHSPTAHLYRTISSIRTILGHHRQEEHHQGEENTNGCAAAQESSSRSGAAQEALPPARHGGHQRTAVELRRLDFLAAWAQRVLAAYEPRACSSSPTSASDLLPTTTTTTLPCATGPAQPDTAFAEQMAKEEAVRTLPVERRLSFPGGYSYAHASATAASARLHTHASMHDLTGTAAALPSSSEGGSTGGACDAAAAVTQPATMTAAALLHNASLLTRAPPPPIVSRGRPPLCRVVGAAFDVPATRAAQSAVLAAQGGCCARCGVELQLLPSPLMGWIVSVSQRLAACMTAPCVMCTCGRRRGAASAEDVNTDSGGAGMCASWCCGCGCRCCGDGVDVRSHSDAASSTSSAASDSDADERASAGGVGGIGAGRPALAPRVGGDDDAADDASSGAASERDQLLGGVPAHAPHRTRRPRRGRSTASVVYDPVTERVTVLPAPRSARTVTAHASRSTSIRVAARRRSAEAFEFCAYEGHYLCTRCFHAPHGGSGDWLGAAASRRRHPALAAPSTRYIDRDGWQPRDAATEAEAGGAESPVRAAVVRASEHLQEWWLTRHLAQPTPSESTFEATASRTSSHLEHPLQPDRRRHPPPAPHSLDAQHAPASLRVLPAHVLHHWDFTRYPVSATAAAALQRRSSPGGYGSGCDAGTDSADARESGLLMPAASFPRHPHSARGGPETRRAGAAGGEDGQTWWTPPELYDITAINPALYTSVPALAAAARLRQRLSLLHAQAWWCPAYRRELWTTSRGPSRRPPPRHVHATAPASSPSPARGGAVGAVDGDDGGGVDEAATPPPLSLSVASSSHHAETTSLLAAAAPRDAPRLSDEESGRCSPVALAGVAGAPSCGRGFARRRYLVERAEGWSLQDLHRLTSPHPTTAATAAAAAPSSLHSSAESASLSAASPLLLVELQDIFEAMRAHVSGCAVCSAQCRGLGVGGLPLSSAVCRD